MGATITNNFCNCGICYCCRCCGLNDEWHSLPDEARDLNQLQEDSKHWKTGDIIVERSPNTVDNSVVKSSSNAPWTHAGLVYKDENGVTILVEMTREELYHTPELAPHYMKLLGNEEYFRYIGHRSLSPALTDEQIIEFKKGMDAIKKRAPTFDTIGQFGAGCDCCDCIPFCGENCCGIYIKSNEERLEELFCTELAAEILKRVGIMKEDWENDEVVPGDFHEGTEGKWINDKYSYSKIIYYGRPGLKQQKQDNVPEAEREPLKY
eukprot:222609_1